MKQSGKDQDQPASIDIREEDNVNESAFKALIRQAVALNSSGKAKPKKSTK